MSRPVIGGPLGELLEAMPEPPDGARSLVHGRVLEAALDDATAWVLASFDAAPDAASLHRALKERLEALFLSELSRSAASFREHGRKRFEKIWFATFAPLPSHADRALAPFALSPGDVRLIAFRRALAALRHEGGAGVDEPSALFEATIENDRSLDEPHDALARALGDHVFGVRPRHSFDAALRCLDITPRRDLLETLSLLERRVVSSTRGVVRFVPPLFFQAMADGAAAAVHALGREVQWAESHDDEGLFAPPLFRFRDASGWAHVPIGVELLRWCVMPLGSSEGVPPFTEWVAGTFR
jgi:hypothetical protein